ncbi:MAG TPA: hypothetical protein VI750_01835 [Pyrinomonadaceae bacterium]|nr:hypothetical protein [Pyrinomonadaceae bacterium]
MNKGTLFWLIIFSVSAAGFFLIAAVVAYKGIGDLRDLLHLSSDQTR